MRVERLVTDDELLAMVLYTGMHLDRRMADEAARRVSQMWGRPVNVLELPLSLGSVWVLYDSEPGHGPEIDDDNEATS